jgi:hypothetical protein
MRPHTERKLLAGTDVAPVTREQFERVECGFGRFGIAGRDHAPAHIAPGYDDGVTDMNAATDPLVLFVSPTPISMRKRRGSTGSVEAASCCIRSSDAVESIVAPAA